MRYFSISLPHKNRNLCFSCNLAIIEKLMKNWMLRIIPKLKVEVKACYLKEVSNCTGFLAECEDYDYRQAVFQGITL